MEPVREGIAYSYTGFEDIEEEFSSALDQSLEPSGPAMLLDVVGSLGLPVGCVALDVGSGEGRYAIPLAERFGFTVLGIDPVQAQIDRSNHAKTDATVGVQERVDFRLGRAEQLPVDDDSSSLVFCRDTLTWCLIWGRPTGSSVGCCGPTEGSSSTSSSRRSGWSPGRASGC
jgi:SAM-dependent methyltransferase